MSKKLSGKDALVTGGSRGIGAATALALAEEGADVVISYTAAADKAAEVVKKIEPKESVDSPSKPIKATPLRLQGS